MNAAFALYWERGVALAARCPSWPTPRLRHIAVIRRSGEVRPFAQILNTSAWSLYAEDFAPSTSSVELLAYLLTHGERMAITGEITRCALLLAPYWFDLGEPEIEGFRQGAQHSTRPDAAAFQALAESLPWLRRLHHDTFRPPPHGHSYRSIPGSGLWVPRAIEAEPPKLVQAWTQVASTVLEGFRGACRGLDPKATTELLDWLRDERPPLLITGKNERILWDPTCADRLGTVRSELRPAVVAAVQAIHADLRTAASKTGLFHASLLRPAELPKPHPDTLQNGYTYLHRERGLIAYNLHDPAFERLQGPALPYGLPMLAARTIHEWTHLAVDAGWVPVGVSPTEYQRHERACADALDAIVGAAPAHLRQLAESDLHALRALYPRARSHGAALTQLLLGRISDYQGNLLARHYLDPVERETYVRHNVRTLRGLYRPQQSWRMLLRYLTELQYLRFSSVADPFHFVLSSTWLADDLIRPGWIEDRAFRELAETIAQWLAVYTVDETKLRLPRAGSLGGGAVALADYGALEKRP